ncbi:MAG: hypothetical protein ACRERE_37460 [Candidatus Entotheonellia bacterium]
MNDEDSGKHHEAQADQNAPSSSDRIESQVTKPPVSDASMNVIKDEAEEPGVRHQDSHHETAKTKGKSIDRITASDRWIIFLTGIIALSGIAGTFIIGWQLSVMRGQLEEMQRSSADTRALAESAKKQAENTERLASAAIEQVRHLEVSAKETHALAAATQDTLELARTNFAKDQRRIIWVSKMPDLNLTIGQQLKWDIPHANYGKSPAIGLLMRSQIVFGKDKEKRIDPNLFKPIYIPKQPPSGSVVVPGDSTNFLTALSKRFSLKMTLPLSKALTMDCPYSFVSSTLIAMEIYTPQKFVALDCKLEQLPTAWNITKLSKKTASNHSFPVLTSN